MDVLREQPLQLGLIRKVLYVIEDNLRPEYEEERKLLNKLILDNKEYIEKADSDKRKEMIELERLEKEILKELDY